MFDRTPEKPDDRHSSKPNLPSQADLEATDYPPQQLGHQPMELQAKDRKIDLKNVYQGMFEKPATRKT